MANSGELEVEWEGLLSGDAAEEPGTDKLLRLLDEEDREEVLAEYDVFVKYLQQVQDSGGFDITVCPKASILGLTSVVPMAESFEREYPELLRLAGLAIRKYNTDKNTGFKVVAVENSNVWTSNYYSYYLTFTARDEKSGVQNTFQAIVAVDMVGRGPTVVTLCRVKRT